MKKLCFSAAIITVFVLMKAPAGYALPPQEQAPAAVDEQAKSRPDKGDIIGMMTRINKMTARQKQQKLEEIISGKSGDATPRSDFLFCLGLAYLDDGKGQICVGEAFENSKGIVEDLMDAYVWYSIARKNENADSPSREKANANLERLKIRMFSVYPPPSEDELESLEVREKEHIKQYRSEIH
jgi:hypothetical protein